jgi:transposase
MQVTALGIDLAKAVFQLHGVDRHGKAVLRKKLSRGQLLTFVANLPCCQIGMEACGGASYWAREFRKLGHEVKLIAPQFVRPYVKSNKNDAADAEAICEALLRPHMRFVTPKSVDQQDLQSLNRIRSRLVAARTALINEARGLLGEYGVVLPKGSSWVRKRLAESVDQALAEAKMTTMSRRLFEDLLEELAVLEVRIKRYDAQVQAIHRSHPVCQRLARIPGVGPVTTTAVVGAVGDPLAFKNGRQFAAWLGLVPRQYSSGGKERLLGISKRGDVHLRTLLIHGARTVIRHRDENAQDKRGKWLNSLIERRGVNRATVALANKNARSMWVLMARGEDYREAA